MPPRDVSSAVSGLPERLDGKINRQSLSYLGIVLGAGDDFGHTYPLRLFTFWGQDYFLQVLLPEYV